jgi:phage terminase large subunit GpA-like protein
MNAPLTQSAMQVMSAAAARAVRPRDRLLPSQWADKHRVLSTKGSNESGQWRTSRNPMLREIMDCMSPHSPVREITIMKSSQVGVTEGPFISAIGFYMDHSPCPVMVLMPTIEARDTWKVQKLNPLLTDTPCVRELLGGMKSRDASNSKDVIDFPGGILFLAGGNSPNSYAQKSAKVVMLDDLDRFPAEVGDEGDPVELGRGRMKSFPNSYKYLKASTPTIKGASLIEREFEAGDMRRYHVACPHCGERQVLRWSNVKANAQLDDAWYECEHCGSCIEEHRKPRMLADGIWIPEHPERKKHRSYHISAIYAPIGLGPSWLDLVIQFKRVHKEPVQLKTFVNQNLGESWEDQTDKLKSNELEKRAGDYGMGIIPPGVLAITVGIDTQDKWLAITLLGWGAPAHEHGPARLWILDWAEIQGDTASPQVWNELEAYLHRPLVNSYGCDMRIRAAGIDSRGHRTEEVKNFVMRSSLKIPVYSVQGATNRIGRAIAQSGSSPTKTRTGKTVRHGYMVWNVGTEYCKDHIFANLAADGERQPGECVFNFPQGLTTEYFDGLLSEVYDPEKKRYIPRLGAKYKRNEPLDTLVYAWAAGHHRDVNIGRGRAGRPDPKYWERLEVMLESGGVVEVQVKRAADLDAAIAAAPAQVQTPKPAKPAKPAAQRSPFVKDDWRGFKR